jgi:hypothetical protein
VKLRVKGECYEREKHIKPLFKKRSKEKIRGYKEKKKKQKSWRF